MKVKISFEIEYDLQTKSKEVQDSFLEGIKTFYENNLPIAWYGFFKELSQITISSDYAAKENENGNK